MLHDNLTSANSLEWLSLCPIEARKKRFRKIVNVFSEMTRDELSLIMEKLSILSSMRDKIASLSSQLNEDSPVGDIQNTSCEIGVVSRDAIAMHSSIISSIAYHCKKNMSKDDIESAILSTRLSSIPSLEEIEFLKSEIEKIYS